MAGQKLTKAERAIVEKAGQLWNQFLQLEEYHKDHTNDFRRAIHDIQRIVGVRMMTRQFMDESKGVSKAVETSPQTMGRAGGLARMATLSPERRREIGRLGAKARWSKN